MGTTTRSAINDFVQENYANPEFMGCYSSILKKMASGFWSAEYVNQIVQKWKRFDSYDLVDAYCFGQVHHAIWTGKVITAEVDMGCEPRGDIESEYHNEILSSLQAPFFGQFQGGPGGDCDGHFGWSEPLKMGNIVDDGSGGEIPFLKTIGPARLPLEVGTTAADTTWFHILMGMGVARWPYGSKKIHLMYSLMAAPNMGINL